MGSSLHGTTNSVRSLFQCRLPSGSQPPSGNQSLQPGVHHRLQMDHCSTMDLHGLQGDNLSHYDLLHGLQGHLISCAGAPPPPPSLTLVPARLLLSYVFTPLSAAIAQFFPCPLTVYPGDVTTSADGMALLQLFWTSHRSHFHRTSLPKPQNANTTMQYYPLGSQILRSLL